MSDGLILTRIIHHGGTERMGREAYTNDAPCLRASVVNGPGRSMKSPGLAVLVAPLLSKVLAHRRECFAAVGDGQQSTAKEQTCERPVLDFRVVAQDAICSCNQASIPSAIPAAPGGAGLSRNASCETAGGIQISPINLLP